MSDALNEISRVNKHPHAGQVFRHFKGGLYVVLTITSNSENRTISVSYMSLDTGRRWDRELYGDNGWLTPKKLDNGTETERFTYVGEAEIRIEGGKYYVTRKY